MKILYSILIVCLFLISCNTKTKHKTFYKNGLSKNDNERVADLCKRLDAIYDSGAIFGGYSFAVQNQMKGKVICEVSDIQDIEKTDSGYLLTTTFVKRSDNGGWFCAKIKFTQNTFDRLRPDIEKGDRGVVRGAFAFSVEKVKSVPITLGLDHDEDSGDPFFYYSTSDDLVLVSGNLIDFVLVNHK